jgi:uncharacterized membrane protein YfbV (UPF0208 family)
MVSGVDYCQSRVPVSGLYFPKKEVQQQQAKNGYWLNELDSLGIETKQKKEELNDAEELENLADIIKQAMFQNYKIAYSEKGDTYREEAESTVTFV